MNEHYISIRDVQKNYGASPALTNLNLELQGARIVGLCGPNGAGKTTLIKILVGLLRDFSGEVEVLGNPIGAKSKAAISYLPDLEYLDKNLTGLKMAKQYAMMYDDFDAYKLEELFERFKLDGTMRVAQMSKGMKEKFQLALCLSRNADIYIFDEPIAGVDPASRDSILDAILTNYMDDALLIISTHLIADIENILDEVVFIKDGQVILHENCDEVREETGKTIDELFREEFKW